jgi:hypothetical protein
MRLLLLTAAFGLSAAAASAGPLTCWYNPEGNLTGADGGSNGLPEARWGLSFAVEPPEVRESRDYAYMIVLPTYESGQDCAPNVDFVAE